MYTPNVRFISAIFFFSAAVASAQAPKPPAHYWMSVDTTNTNIPGLSAEDAAMMAALGRGMPGAGAQRSLLLQLSAPGAQGAPEATHDIPPGKNMGRTLPLTTPVPVPASPGEAGEPFERPRGRMLIYWGCGDAVRAGQPLMIDFANTDPAKLNLPPGRVGALQPPPGPARERIYAVWPYERNAMPVPRDSSLVGEHLVRGNYPPAIRFAIGAGHDFMAPVNFSSVTGGLADAIHFQWDSVPNATGYFAMAIGGGERESEAVFWTSSEMADMGGGLVGYLPPAQVQTLIQDKVVLPPQSTRCTIPQGIFRNARGASLTLNAYGGELNVVHPPRPADPKAKWDPEWFVKVRLKSTGMVPLGVEDAAAGRSRGRAAPQPQSQGGAPPAAEPRPAEPAKAGGPNPRDAVRTLKGIFGF